MPAAAQKLAQTGPAELHSRVRGIGRRFGREPSAGKRIGSRSVSSNMVGFLMVRCVPWWPRKNVIWTELYRR
jgi:hypothetical protein